MQSSQTENNVKIMSFHKTTMNFILLAQLARELSVNVNKSEKVTHLMIYTKTKGKSSHL